MKITQTDTPFKLTNHLITQSTIRLNKTTLKLVENSLCIMHKNR